ncbi:MAG: response regulator transcription factor [Elusimicrobiota bacterium]
MRYRIFIADDDKDFLDVLERYLKAAGFEVSKFPNAKSALSAAGRLSPDLVVTDVEMPGISGFEFLKALRENPRFVHTPVILMSGKRISEIDMIEGYQKGTDDYLVKPFSMQVFTAKIKTLLKRAYPDRGDKENTVSVKDLRLSLDTRKTFLGKKEIKLTRKEFDLLLTLVRSQGKIVSYDKILDAVWGYQSDSYSDPHTIEAHISSLRKKLGKGKNSIKNVSGHGYMLEL